MWYYTFNNQQAGPVDENEIKKMIEAGSITHTTMVWTSGMANWLPIGQTSLASMMGAVPPPPVMPYPMAFVENPKVKKLKSFFTWFWISLAIGIFFTLLGWILSFVFIGVFFLPIGFIGIGASMVLFTLLFHKAWQMVQHEGIRATADQAVVYCFVVPWNFYWFFPAFRGLAKELNQVLANEKIASEPMNLDLALWFAILLNGSMVGIGIIPFIVIAIMYTKKLTDTLVAITLARG